MSQLGSNILDKIPPVLAVANIHPDHLDVCISNCCTGSRQQCRLPVGAVTLVRRTSGGSTKRSYGVVGVWYFTGVNEPVPRREHLWPSRWHNKVIFEPIVQRFKAPWCEDFSAPPANNSKRKTSLYVPGLSYTHLQGVILRIKNQDTAHNYLKALLHYNSQELESEVSYLGHECKASDILRHLMEKLKGG